MKDDRIHEGEEQQEPGEGLCSAGLEELAGLDWDVLHHLMSGTASHCIRLYLSSIGKGGAGAVWRQMHIAVSQEDDIDGISISGWKNDVKAMGSNLSSLLGSHLINSAYFYSYTTCCILYFAIKQMWSWINAWKMTFCKYLQKLENVIYVLWKRYTENPDMETFTRFSNLFSHVWTGLWAF